MKRFKQMLAVLLCAVALCGLAPAALAAQPLDESENGGKVIIYFETCGGHRHPGGGTHQRRRQAVQSAHPHHGGLHLQGLVHRHRGR